MGDNVTKGFRIPSSFLSVWKAIVCMMINDVHVDTGL